jgi:hypothetical protein
MALKIMHRIIFFIFFFLFIFFPGFVFAEENSYITIVNPQRISSYTKGYLESFKAQRFEVESRGLPATWLVTYDVLSRDNFVEELKKLNSEQELGIFLEITEPFAIRSNVVYNKTDNWHRATSLFLSGYGQKDRVKLIDAVFELFKKRFGYYPKSVGSWWTDSYSQSYMKEKYGITGNLGVSDQYDLDGYQVWGTWWSVPYYPSKINTAVPGHKDNKLDVLQFRWAARDPINGYNIESKFPASMYSLQDYQTVGLSDSYFEGLFDLYVIKKPYNEFGHITVGLEGDMGKDSYKGTFANHMDSVKNYLNRGMVEVLTMRDFALLHREKFGNRSSKHLIESFDLLKKNKKVFWFQNQFYRIGIEHNNDSNRTKIIDLREYYENLKEPNYLEPNKQYNLNINLPFIIDSVIKPSSATNLDLGKFERIENNSLVFEKGIIQFKDKEIVLPDETVKIKNKFEVPESGLIYRNYSYSIPFAIRRRLPFPQEYILIAGLVAGGLSITFFKKKGVFMVLGFVVLLAVGSIIISPDYKFYISQDEYEALNILSRLPKGNVLVYDKDCLKCNYASEFKSASMAGKKGYVNNYSRQTVSIDYNFQIAKTSADAHEILKEKNISYVYLSKYGGYIEQLPYLPQDLNLERVYINANAEIWKVK